MPINTNGVRYAKILGMPDIVHYTLGYVIRIAAPFLLYSFYLYFDSSLTTFISQLKTYHASNIFVEIIIFGELFIFAAVALGAAIYLGFMTFCWPEPAPVKFLSALVLLIATGIYVYAAFWVGLNGLLFTANGLIGEPAHFIMTAFTILFMIPLFIVIGFLNK